MYEEVGTGARINGEITARNQNTMVVVGEDGYTHLCKLIGKPGKRPDFSLEGKKNNFDNAAPQQKVKVIEANGKTRIFTSVGETAKHYFIDRRTIRLGCDNGRVTTRGKVKGFQFSWAEQKECGTNGY